MKISDLRPDNHNANRGTKRGAEMIEDSLRKYGAGRSILIDREGRVMAGNKTLEQAGQIGMENVIVVQTDGSQLVAVQRMDLDLERDARAKELAVADNRAGELSLAWSGEVLKELDAEIDLKPFFSDEELAKIIVGDGTDLAPDSLDEPRKVECPACGLKFSPK